MKVIRINKSYRNGNRELFLVLLDELDFLEGEDLKDEITELVERECDKDVGGAHYGYSYKWEFVKDEEKETINRAIEQERCLNDNIINKLTRNIKYLKSRNAKIRKEYRKLNRS